MQYCRRASSVSAVADHLGGEPLQQPVPVFAGMEDHGVGMAVDVNKARRRRQSAGVDDLAGGLAAVGPAVGKHDGVPLHADAAAIGLRAGAVHDLRVFDEKIQHHISPVRKGPESRGSPGFPLSAQAFL